MDNAAFSQLVAKKVEDGKFDIRKSIKADKASRKQQKKNYRKKQEEGTLPEQLAKKSELLAATKGKGRAKKDGGYRDRAKERRTDTNPDYKGSAELAETVAAEYTQFLGGDEEHTHLVKGTPRLLLLLLLLLPHVSLTSPICPPAQPTQQCWCPPALFSAYIAHAAPRAAPLADRLLVRVLSWGWIRGAGLDTALLQKVRSQKAQPAASSGGEPAAAVPARSYEGLNRRERRSAIAEDAEKDAAAAQSAQAARAIAVAAQKEKHAIKFSSFLGRAVHRVVFAKVSVTSHPVEL